MDILITIAAVVILIVALVGIVDLTGRRRHRRIAERLTARGLKVVRTRFTTIPSMRDVVEYIGPDGDLRQMAILLGATEACEDVPFQTILRRRYEEEESQPLLRAIKLAAERGRLPGFEDYKTLMRELAAGADAITIDESAPNETAKWRFAPILQCIETESIASESASRLDLSVDGVRLDVCWSVHGLSPHRRLVIAAQRPQPNIRS